MDQDHILQLVREARSEAWHELGTLDRSIDNIYKQLIQKIQNLPSPLPKDLIEGEPISTRRLSNRDPSPSVGAGRASSSASTVSQDDSSHSLQERYDRLQQQYEELQARYEKESQGWAAFRKWWHESVVGKNEPRSSPRKVFTPIFAPIAGDVRIGSNAPGNPSNATTSPVTPIQVRKKGDAKVRLSEDDKSLLRNLGLTIPSSRSTTSHLGNAAASSHHSVSDADQARKGKGTVHRNDQKAQEDKENQPVILSARDSRTSRSPGPPNPLQTPRQIGLSNIPDRTQFKVRTEPPPSRRIQVFLDDEDSTQSSSRRSEVFLPQGRGSFSDPPQAKSSKRGSVPPHLDSPSPANLQMSHERSIALKPKRRSPPLLLASKLDEHDEESNLPINNTVKRTCPSGSMENLDDAEANRRHILEFRARQKEDLEKNPWKYKGRGRYADQMPKPGEKSFNAEFTIDPSFNAGRDFAFKGVERKKSVRKRMHAFDCDCCKDYYENIGPMPPPAGPVWRAPFDSASSKERPQNELIPSSSSKKRQYGAGEEESGFDRDELLRLDYSEDETENRGVFSDKNDDEAAERAKKLKREQEIQNHKQMTSRHRDHGIPNLTPPGYWMINFPSTQEQEQINREAKAMEKKRREQLSRDPRFRRREN